ncbi:MAG: hypothetical protein QME57_04550 [Patescibacteria group bacterium]|nr:hypothetical protein [Patescibacteria group bacterium]
MDPGSRFNIGDEPFRTAFNKFEILLKECSLCAFIGFSFHDKDVIEMLLYVSTTKSKPLHILIVNKDSDINKEFVRKRLEEVAKLRPMNYNYEKLQIDFFEGFIEDKNTQTKIIDRISNILHQ